MAKSLTLPKLAPSVEHLRSLGNPIIDLQLALLYGSGDVEELRVAVAGSSQLEPAFESQRGDGSWGDEGPAIKRLLPTLWMVKTLGELGLDADDPRWLRAVEFLMDVGHTSGGVFSIRGTRDGVLSCYVGIAAAVYLAGGLPDLAEPQVRWVLRHQEVAVRGEHLRLDPVEEWSAQIRERYGGCMADTTCLIGLLRVGRPLQLWLSHQEDTAASAVVGAIRQAFLRRRVMFRSDDSIVPLGVSPKNAESWLAPTYPLDWRVDLIEALEFLANAGPPDVRMQQAVDHIVGLRLPDGTWPLRRTFRPEHLPKLEPLSTRRGSPYITMRVVRALHALGAER